MIHEIGVELQAELLKRGAPFAVVDGPEPSKTTTWGRERIVIEYDKEAADSFGPPRSKSINPKRRYEALEACKVTIYAKSNAAGATTFEHETRAKEARDVVLTALEYVAAVRKNRFVPGAGRLFTPPDLAETERPGGAAYELKFGYSRSVPTLKWSGAKQTEGTITAATNTTKVRQPGDAEDAGVPACGA